MKRLGLFGMTLSSALLALMAAWALAESCTCFRGGSNRSNLNVTICSLLITTKIFLIVAAVISRDFVMTFIVAVVVVELLPT